ncbi:MAG: hypothetical protein Q8P18_21770 [Pseudomonadota bacterium]|nr:hypothetical protein [Pseudomonadota bacterium]
MRAFSLVALSSLMVSPLVGCGFGLTSALDGKEHGPAVQDEESAAPDDGTSDDGTPDGDTSDEGGGEDTLPATSADLDDTLYAIDRASMRVTEPPGLDALFGEVLDRDVFVYVERASASTIELAVALAGTDGQQDPCEAVRAFPAGDWSANPVFDVGPGQLTTSFGGQSATFRSLVLSGVFDESGAAWRDGTLAAELDTRELAAALGDIDGCELVADLGGECVACSDGEEACFALRIEGIVADRVETSFDASPDARSCAD